MSEENTKINSVNDELNGDTIETTKDEDKKSLVEKNGDVDQDKDIDENEPEPDATEIEVDQTAETEDWYPDGGWGWFIVVGAVIIHVYVGKTEISMIE